MKTIIIATLASAYLNVCHAESASVTEIIAYKGTIAESDIFMTLSERNGTIVGGYQYTKYSTTIPLLGSIDNNHIRMTEKTNSSEADIATEVKDELMQGVWKTDKVSHNFYASALSKSYKKLISSIDISNSNEITITFIDNRRQSFEIEVLTETISIVFEDHNFDGFPDLRVLETSGPNRTYIAWTYDPNERIFKHSTKMSTLSNPKVLHSEKAILSLSQDGCCHYIASKSTDSKEYAAEFEYAKLIGIERITDTKTKVTTTHSINKKDFERKYITPMGAEGL